MRERKDHIAVLLITQGIESSEKQFLIAIAHTLFRILETASKPTVKRCTQNYLLTILYNPF